MATPSESITTVNGRRCTRSRARTAATTSQTKNTATSTAAITSTSTTTSQDVQQTQTSTAQTSSSPPPPPPPPASSAPPPPAVSSAPAASTEQAAQPVVGTTAPTDAVAGTSSTGTLSTVLISSSARIGPLAFPSSKPATAALGPPPAAQASVEVPLQIPVVSSAPSTSSTPTIPSPTSIVPSPIPTDPSPVPTDPSPIPTDPSPVPTVSGPVPTSSDSISTAVPSSIVEASGAPALSTAPPASGAPASVDTNTALPLESGTDLPSSITRPVAGRPRPTSSLAGGSAGIIAPNQGSSSDDSPLTLSRNGNIGGIMGGVFGGIAGLALISVLLFFCLRKRKSKPVKWNEKRQEYPSFLEKLRSIPTGLGEFVARLKGNRTGSTQNSYQRHVPKASVDSVYSRDSNGQSRSNSKVQGAFGVKRTGSSGSTKSDRNVLRKKPSSISAYRFPDIAEDTGTPNPFADPQQTRPLLILNPDPKSTPGTPQMPAATADPEPKDPFASVYDPPPAAPAWERGAVHTHQRATSSASGQSSQPTWSLFATDNPFRDPPNVPPLPNQAVLPEHHRRRSSMALPNFNPTTTFDANSTFATRDSGMYFGEPGPSRPATNVFTPVTPARRTIRQSDPFDLDRPEVLGFGGISRQNTRSKRTSNASNWYNTAGNGASNNPPLPTGTTKPQWGSNSGR